MELCMQIVQMVYVSSVSPEREDWISGNQFDLLTHKKMEMLSKLLNLLHFTKNKTFLYIYISALFYIMIQNFRYNSVRG